MSDASKSWLWCGRLTCGHVRVVVRRELGEAKIGHLGLEVGIQQDVARLHVAVDDARLAVLQYSTRVERGALAGIL